MGDEQAAAAKNRQANQGRSPGGDQASAVESEAGRPNLFLKNSSATLPPRRQQLSVSNTDIADTQNQYQLAMGEALARHEAELLRVGALKRLQEDDFRAQIRMQEDVVRAEQDQALFKKVQLHQELGQQVRERHQKTQAEHHERKEHVLTSGGPTMEAEDVGELEKKFRNQKLLTKVTLSKQRDAEEQDRKGRRAIEVE